MAQATVESGEAPALTVAPLLRVEHLSVRFGSFHAVDDIDLEIEPGSIIAVTGENGSGKSTLVRCVGGDISPTSGKIFYEGKRITPSRVVAARHRIRMVRQELEHCDTLDVAANLLLGNEPTFSSRGSRHAKAQWWLDLLGIRLSPTMAVATLSGGERQLLAIARAMAGDPKLLVLDEPATALGPAESAQFEQLTSNIREYGTTILLVSSDIDQMFRLADQIVVLRQGKVVARVNPARSRPEDVISFITGQQTDAYARRQLNRLQGLAERLATTDPSSSLPLILSALGGALGTSQLCIHLAVDDRLCAVTDVGMPASMRAAWAELELGDGGGPVGRAAARQETIVATDVRTSADWTVWRPLAAEANVCSSWSVPVIGDDRLLGVITVFRESIGDPPPHELRLADLYAGFAASAVQRERLLREVTARNRQLETIRDVLETLAGPASLSKSLQFALHALRQGLEADHVTLLSCDVEADPAATWRATSADEHDGEPPEALLAAVVGLRPHERRDGRATSVTTTPGVACLAVSFAAPGGNNVLLAEWVAPIPPAGSVALLEDAANSLRLARERQESERAREEASALRRSREIQRAFLSRLSHELRTPLTAIGGYASTLLAADVTWDGESEQRFLRHIDAESARLNRLVGDLLDFSAIESSTLRLQRDWCDVKLVIEAAVACVAPSGSDTVDVVCPDDLPAIWADHDRLEQVFVNLLENALRHNPPGTRVAVEAVREADAGIAISVTDTGAGLPDDVVNGLFQPRRSGYGPHAGSGLGLSIAKGIIDAHAGRLELAARKRGTRFSLSLPIGGPDASHRYAEDRERSDV
jgi:signal transduction histidine kinase/ABC-type multidrug transport system ATPase subunit